MSLESVRRSKILNIVHRLSLDPEVFACRRTIFTEYSYLKL